MDRPKEIGRVKTECWDTKGKAYPTELWVSFHEEKVILCSEQFGAYILTTEAAEAIAAMLKGAARRTLAASTS